MFFILTGARVNLPAIFSSVDQILVLLAIIVVGILSKAVGVFVATKLSGLNTRNSAAFGLFHSARLSLIIAAADISIRLDIISQNVFAMFIILAIISATVSPALGKYILSKKLKSSL